MLSIDIGSSKMKFVVGKATGKGIDIKKMFYAQTPQNSVVNGEITDVKELREALLVEVKNHRLAGQKTIVTIQSSAFIFREFSIVRLKEKDVESALRFEVEQHMPLVMDDYILSYKEMQTYTGEEGAQLVKYAVGLMPQRIVSTYYEVLRSVKLKPAAMDVNSNAIEKLLDICGDEIKNGILLFADIGHDAMDMSVFENGTPQINRTVPIGGAEITKNISRTFGIEYEEAEIKKIQSQVLNDENNEHIEVTAVTKKVISDWIEQLRRMIDFYMSRNQGKSVDTIYLYGGSSAIKRLDEYLSDVFGIEVKIMALPEGVTVKQTSPAPIYTFFNAIGALIRR